jgi:hypothetical protein
MNIEIQIKIGELVIGYDEARELYAKLRTVFGPLDLPAPNRMQDAAAREELETAYRKGCAKATELLVPTPSQWTGPIVNTQATPPPPVPIGTVSTTEGAVTVLKDAYVPPPGQVDSGTLCP